MLKPHIEYHYATFRWGSWHNQYDTCPVGTTFAEVKLVNYPDDPTFTPLRLRWSDYAWPGGYEIYYITKDGGVLCHQCANHELDRTLDQDDDDFCVISYDVNYEYDSLFCDHCNRCIEPAYGDQP